MRDGVHLDTNVFKPAGNRRFPAILMRTPYGKGTDLPPGYPTFLDRGYAVVMQDVRGRYGSQGVFDALKQEGPDGYDTMNWIAEQPWSNGKIGMTGGSYLGIAQWRVALLNNPHLKAIFPVVSGVRRLPGSLLFSRRRHQARPPSVMAVENMSAPGTPKPKFDDYVTNVPLRTSDRAATRQTLRLYQTILNHPTYDAFWKQQSVLENIGHVHVPVFAVGGWYDNYVESDLDAFSALHKVSGSDDKHHILIGPWAHNMSTPFAGINFGDDSSAPIRSYQLDWFDHWLKGQPDDANDYSPEAWHSKRSEVDEAPIHIFVMGVNRWRDEQEWPLARTRYTPLYLTSKGHANTLTGDGKLEWKLAKKTYRRSFPLRSSQPGADTRRRGVLRSEGFPLGSHGPARGGEPCRRVGIHQRSFKNRPGSDRADSRHAVRFHLSLRHRLYGQAGGRVPERRSAQPDRRHPAHPLPQRPGETGTGAAGRGVSVDNRRRRNQQRIPGGPFDSHRDLEQ